jgi:hypothetical protein
MTMSDRFVWYPTNGRGSFDRGSFVDREQKPDMSCNGLESEVTVWLMIRTEEQLRAGGWNPASTVLVVLKSLSEICPPDEWQRSCVLLLYVPDFFAVGVEAGPIVGSGFRLWLHRASKVIIPPIPERT